VTVITCRYTATHQMRIAASPAETPGLQVKTMQADRKRCWRAHFMIRYAHSEIADVTEIRYRGYITIGTAHLRNDSLVRGRPERA
jgi:hypothetical protein